MILQADYIWHDGAEPTQGLRSKTRIVDLPEQVSLSDFPEWSYDGSSTNQASGNDSDLAHKPVSFIEDPIRGAGNYLVLCEVMNPDGTPHSTNHRATLRQVLEEAGTECDPIFGFEQEYTMFQNGRPLGCPETGFPGPQGPYYCGLGGGNIVGREIVEAHTQACIDAGINIYGINAEVMMGQWEYQIGFRGFDGDTNDAITNVDHKEYAAYLLLRIAEEFEVKISFENKPIKGDWNGAGCHTNFSTKVMRDASTGKQAIDEAVSLLAKKHQEHIEVYGYKNDERLTGLHETCPITEFRVGDSDRGASIRIPLSVRQKGYGYIEDRRPGANANSYQVAARLIQTVCLKK